jgi:hypothetical protein
VPRGVTRPSRSSGITIPLGGGYVDGEGVGVAVTDLSRDAICAPWACGDRERLGATEAVADCNWGDGGRVARATELFCAGTGSEPFRGCKLRWSAAIEGDIELKPSIRFSLPAAAPLTAAVVVSDVECDWLRRLPLVPRLDGSLSDSDVLLAG